eukprot:m.106756 g.106756  ORF g.106756 m.106756 type:complete len:104 (-) comp12681_c2_seq1:1996-2307(-)
MTTTTSSSNTISMMTVCLLFIGQNKLTRSYNYIMSTPPFPTVICLQAEGLQPTPSSDQTVSTLPCVPLLGQLSCTSQQGWGRAAPLLDRPLSHCTHAITNTNR